MIERTEWRLRSDDPQTPLGWALGTDRWGKVPVYPIVVGTLAFTIVVGHACEAWLPSGVGGAVEAFLSTGSVGVLLAALAPKPYEVPVPDPSPGSIHVGTVGVELGKRRLGGDRGTIAFDEGWLLFEGLRTSFALSGGDVKWTRSVGSERYLDLTSGHRLRISGVGGFAMDFERWLAGPPAAGLSRLPPTDPHPQMRVRKASILMAVSASALGSGIGIAATSAWSTFIVGTAFACAFVAALCALFARRVRLA